MTRKKNLQNFPNKIRTSILLQYHGFKPIHSCQIGNIGNIWHESGILEGLFTKPVYGFYSFLPYRLPYAE